MSNYYLSRLDDPKYHAAFWNAIRNKDADLRSMGCILDDTPLPNVSFTKMKTSLTENSLFRRIATVMQAHGSQYNIMAKDQNDMAAWIPENGEFPIYDGLNDFTIHPLDRFKLGVFLKLDNAFIGDASFSIEDYLIGRLAKNFGEAETAAFISGAGPESGMPTGILADEAAIADWVKPAARAMYALGVIQGSGDGRGGLLFNGGSTLTRAQAVTMLGRIQEKGYAAGGLDGFADGGEVPAWAADYLATMVAQGVLTGMDGNLRPTRTMTRGQAAKVLWALS